MGWHSGCLCLVISAEMLSTIQVASTWTHTYPLGSTMHMHIHIFAFMHSMHKDLCEFRPIRSGRAFGVVLFPLLVSILLFFTFLLVASLLCSRKVRYFPCPILFNVIFKYVTNMRNCVHSESGNTNMEAMQKSDILKMFKFLDRRSPHGRPATRPKASTKIFLNYYSIYIYIYIFVVFALVKQQILLVTPIQYWWNEQCCRQNRNWTPHKNNKSNKNNEKLPRHGRPQNTYFPDWKNAITTKS